MVERDASHPADGVRMLMDPFPVGVSTSERLLDRVLGAMRVSHREQDRPVDDVPGVGVESGEAGRNHLIVGCLAIPGTCVRLGQLHVLFTHGGPNTLTRVLLEGS